MKPPAARTSPEGLTSTPRPTTEGVWSDWTRKAVTSSPISPDTSGTLPV